MIPLILLFLFSCENRLPVAPPVIYGEYHYDRIYNEDFGDFRIITTHKLVDLSCLPEPSRTVAGNLLYYGFDNKTWSETIMDDPDPYITMDDGLKFSTPSNDESWIAHWDTPEFKQLFRERWPEKAEGPVFEYKIDFLWNDIVYHTPEFTVFEENFIIDASGAMHIFYGMEYTTIDVQNEKILSIDDIFIPGTFNILEKIIRAKLKKQGIAETSSHIEDMNYLTGSDQALDELPLPDTFLFEKKEVSFFWLPYSIASYAQGIVSVSIPYNKLEKHLTADGRRLMRTLKKDGHNRH